MRKKLVSTKIRSSVLFYLLIAVAFISVPAFAGVTVYCEGAYTADDLAIYIYADITDGTELRSAGVKLGYNNDALQVKEAERNNDVWFLGNNDYNSPEFANDGVIFILGKLNPDNTAEGVSGKRVLLGNIVFTPKTSMPDLSKFNITLAYGKLGPEGEFANFVDTANPANVLDDTDAVTFGDITIAQRGDANADGAINVNDIKVLQRRMGDSNLPCYVDCNGDGVVNVNDFKCLQRKI